MAFLTDIFAKTPTPAKNDRPTDIPTEKVIMLRDQGLSVNQIMEALQRQGYEIDQISNAINHVDIKQGIIAEKGDNMYEENPDYPRAPPAAQGMGPQGRQMQPPPMQGPQEMPSMGMSGMGGMGGNDERMHEIAEAIIDEKWAEFIENVNKIIEWKDNTESRITKLQQQVDDLRGSFDKLHEGVLGKIGEYDRGIVEIGTEIKALEKVFQRILPGFIENVNELSRITSKMKAKPGTK